MSDRNYPSEPVGPFPTPPIEFVDGADRHVEIHACGDGAACEGTVDALVEMYERFDPADRAQGLPPISEPVIRDWLDTILSPDCLNVIAWHDGEAAGHATLVPDARGETWELAIFVLSDYQSAGIGTQLLKALLGHAASAGVERVWLTVERWNRAAVSLYKSIGFETTDAESFELEMTIRLTTQNGH